jgi:glycosyltransferase involved in cell wall biosynthesis
MADELGIVTDVVFAGFVSEDDLVALYNAAELLLYPSLYEGFGLPVLEAMICGTPVITSPCGSIPEIAGDAAVMVDPHNVEEIAAAMNRVLEDKVLYDNLVAKGKAQAELFSWQRAAEKTFSIYQTAMARM